ncbi:S-(hydroxymethyl)glutathione dehydrogenase / alcohol dehydrogenase [Mycolicibacterium neoaurum]|nr:alcohol dehydrogenase [Mycolicibacterium neoaurum]CDQ47371.1 alcohol dehydrogenase [Mycolicibacterium neoaurum]SDE70097.1 S-(hydroxymethyl)glutathione dehydrogenase / alcohol dehydrogenase [Mycolicibacterium neoaurum]
MEAADLERVLLLLSMKTKGALLWELNSPFTVDEIDLGDPVADEVQIRMHAAGMCHSDYHITTGATPIGLPALGGHEGAGVVTKVGKNVTGIAEGDHVILAFIPACGQCPPCLKGFRSLCDRGAVLLGGKAIADGTSRIHAGGREVSPMNLLGTFAPYMTVHKDSVVKIDDDIPFETAAIMGCAVPTGFGSATNVAEVKPGETVIIVGVGGIGMSALQGAVISGAKQVIAIDPNEWKRDQAIKFGATHVYPSMAEAIGPVIDATYGLMADKVIIAVGEMKGEYIEEAMILTAKTGTCVVTGMGSMMDADVKLNLFLFTMLQKTLKGNIFGGGSSHVETPRLAALYKSGLLNIDDMITRTYKLEDINTGYQDMLDGNNIRGVIRFDESDW